MKQQQSFKIGDRVIGSGHEVYIVAEMSANHGQNYDEAVRIMRAMKDAGANAVKIQTYTPDTITIESDSREFIHGKDSLWSGRSLYELYKEAYTPWEWQPKLQKEAAVLGLDFFSTPFDPTAVDFLEEMNVPVHKIASFELVDIPLIRRVARTGKPIIMSTGMGTVEEIAEAVDAIRDEGNDQLALLKCTSAYPALPDEMNLRTIPDLASRFDVVAGLSDHTLDLPVPIAAVSLGACIIEKHFTLSREIPGPDSAFSLEPAEFKAMVIAIRTVEKALGSVSYERTEKELGSMVFRRSLYVVEDVKAGDPFTETNVRSIRPGLGLPPRYLSRVLRSCAARDLSRGTPLAMDDVSCLAFEDLEDDNRV